MPTIHMICGPLGSGKTTFARHLEGELPALRFTHDEWMAIVYGQDPPRDRFPDFFQRISTLINSLWPKCVDLGWDVILDLNFWKRRQREEVREMVAAHRGTAILYRLDCAKALAWQRIQKRNSDPRALHIAPATFEALWPQFEPPGPDEAAREVSAPQAAQPACAGAKTLARARRLAPCQGRQAG